MFNPHAEPVRNDAPYKRIGIGELPPGDPCMSHATAVEVIELTLRRQDAARIWAIVVETASGTNAPYVAPDEDAA